MSDRFNWLSEIPIKLPVWNDSLVNFRKWQSRFDLCKLPDGGCSGVAVKFNLDDAENSRLSSKSLRTTAIALKKNSITACPFHAKRPTMPLAIHGRHFQSESIERSHLGQFPNSNRLLIDVSRNYVICSSIDSSEVNVYFLQANNLPNTVENSGTHSQFTLRKQSEAFNLDQHHGPLQQVKSWKESNLVSLLQQNALSLVNSDEVLSNGSPSFYLTSKLLESKMQLLSSGQSVPPSSHTLEFKTVSINRLLHGYAIMLIKPNERSLGIVEYNVNYNSPLFTLLQPVKELKFKLPIGLYWLQSHPRICVYGESGKIGLFDLRQSVQESFNSIFSIKDVGEPNVWERFRIMCPLSMNANQHLIATENRLFVCDSRFPKTSLLQWKHCLNCLDDNQLQFLSTERLLASASSENSYLETVLLTNREQMCLLNLTSDKSVIQPLSMHSPLHISIPSDCYHFAMLSDGPLKERLEKSSLIGSSLVPTESGYSIYQLTDQGDIFVQDFYNKSSKSANIDYSWQYAVSESLTLDSASIGYIKTLTKSLNPSLTDAIAETKSQHIEESQLCVAATSMENEEVSSSLFKDLNFAINNSSETGEQLTSELNLDPINCPAVQSIFYDSSDFMNVLKYAALCERPITEAEKEENIENEMLGNGLESWSSLGQELAKLWFEKDDK